MKNIFTVFLISLTFVLSAQSPMLVNYQGVARDGAGNPISGQLIAITFEVLQGSSSGSVIYTDSQTGIQTSTLGIFSTQIGKSGGLGQINWQGGPYYLRVSMDPANGSNLTVLGTQQIVSVPFAVHAENVPSTYTNNVLTIGSKTYAISSGTAVTVSQGTGTNITVTGGPNYTVSYAPPILTLNSNSIGIAGSNAVALPAAVIPTVVASGIATATNGASTYTVNVPAPSYNQQSGVLSFGSNNTVVTPTLGLVGSVLYSGPFSNSVAIPNAVTVSGTGIATVTGFPNYVVNVAPPTLTLSSNNLSLSIVGSNSIAFPAGVTVAGSGSVVNVSGGPTNYTVNVPNPSYNGTVLTLGTSTTNITPALVFNSATGSLFSGLPSNSVSLSNFGPFIQAGTSVSLTTASNSVAIGLSAASAKLDVYSSAGGNVFKVNDANASNSVPAAVFSSNGVGSIFATNTSANGIAGDFSSTGGQALNAVNNSSTFPTIQAQNNNTSPTAFAGNFVGGLAVTGNGNTSANFAFKAINSASSNLFHVRNDGYVGIGAISPVAKLDILGGNLRVEGISGGAGKIFLGSVNGVDDGYTGIHRINDDLVLAVFKAGGGSTFGSQAMDAVTVKSISGNVGIGTASPAQKLDVAGSVKITDGSEGLGKVLTSDAAGVASWQPVTITTTSALSVQGLANVTDVPTSIGSALASFTKVYNDTKIQVILQTHLYVYDLNATNSVKYEIQVGSTSALANTGKANYFIDNGNSLNIPNYANATIIAEFPSTITAGTYSINLLIYAVNSGGTALGAYIDPGNYSASSIIIKEYR